VRAHSGGEGGGVEVHALSDQNIFRLINQCLKKPDYADL